MEAMYRSVVDVSNVDWVLIDGNCVLKLLEGKVEVIVKGDVKNVVIVVVFIIVKVMWD